MAYLLIQLKRNKVNLKLITKAEDFENEKNRKLL